MSDRPEYQQKKHFFNRMLTVYGRNPVLEALQDSKLKVHRLHLADSNKHNSQLSELIRLAEGKHAEVVYHSKQELSRISRNSQQDQGVALDVVTEGFTNADDFITTLPANFELIALDNITNPQNLGMIIRSVCASPLHGILLPEKGCAKLDALVIKASAGTLFKARIIRCEALAKTLQILQQQGTQVFGLDAKSRQTLSEFQAPPRSVMVMGNETHGLSPEVKTLCNGFIAIPMANGVESLNVSVAASLLAFRQVLKPAQ